MSLKVREPECKEKQSQSNKKNDLDMGLNQSDPGELSVLCFSCKLLVQSLKYNFHK